MSPSATIISAGTAAPTVTDRQGRRLTLRRMTSLDKLRLFKAAGPTLAHNQPWLGMAMLACSVAEIDNVPVPPPTNEQQIELMVARLGDLGIAAVAEALNGQPEVTQLDAMAAAGN
jgi:hypothetical protein